MFKLHEYVKYRKYLNPVFKEFFKFLEDMDVVLRVALFQTRSKENKKKAQKAVNRYWEKIRRVW